ncbi:MAG: hypothetical protein AB7I13_22030 [Vicinamibacterales bacterium]
MIPRAAICVLVLAAAGTGCGKKGPPLPPLVRLPAAPAELKADRRGTAVEVGFVLPSANTDGSRPANIQRVDVYALTAAEPASDSAVMKAGTRIGSVDVKAPRDPNATIDADEPDSDLEPLEGPGLDQGAVAQVREFLTAAMLEGPDAVTRTYVGVGITTRGRRGPMSTAVAVSLAPAPPAPEQPSVTYTETALAVAWPPLEPSAAGEAPMRYAVYDVTPAPAEGAAGAAAGVPPPAGAGAALPARLNAELLETTTYSDQRVAWNVERCYAVRAVKIVGALPIEGDASPAACVTPRDTFAPPAPTGLTTVASAGAVNLIWTPSAASDLAGYRVLRATAPSTTLVPLTTDLLTQTTFTDAVQAGVRYSYAVQAVDTAGNASAVSATVEETAR